MAQAARTVRRSGPNQSCPEWRDQSEYSRALEQQTDKGAAHGAAVGRSDMPAKVRLYVILDFCGFRQYVLKYRLFRLIKAVIGYADHTKVSC